MARRLSWTTWVGAAMIALPGAWFIPSAYWAATRNWVPLDVAISLSKGQVQSFDFEANVPSAYLLRIALDPRLKCPEPCTQLPNLQATWSVSEGGKVVARGEVGPDPSQNWWYREVGRCNFHKGVYSLNLEPLKDAGSINALSPRFAIVEDGSRYFEAMTQRYHAFLAVVVLTPIGLCLLIRAGIIHGQEKQVAFLQHFSLTQMGPAPAIPGLFSTGGVDVDAPRLKLPPVRQRIPGLSSIALISVLVLEVVFIPFSILRATVRIVPSGLRVRLRRADLTPARGPGMQPLLVRVVNRGTGVRAGLYLGSDVVSWEDLGGVLEKELRLRPPD